MFAGKTLAQALAIAVKSPSNNVAFHEYVLAHKAHKARWVRASAALKAGDLPRLRAYMAESGEARKDAWAQVKAGEAKAKPAPTPAPVKAKAPAKAQPKAKPAPAPKQAQAIDPALIEAVAQAVLAALTAQAPKSKKVA